MSVAAIVEDVRARGDEAVREWALCLDGAEPELVAQSHEVPEEAILALADRVRRWHELQRPADIRMEVEPGVELERRWVALDSVGVYVPRGLISTLVMCAIRRTPAACAGTAHMTSVEISPRGT